jgi:hypothetical protein
VLLTIAERFRDALVPFLIGGTALLVTMLVVLIAQRLIRAAMLSRHKVLSDRYRPVLESTLLDTSPLALDAVSAIPGRHRGIAAELILAAARVVRGAQVERARTVADHLGLIGSWLEDLGSRFWWHKSEAALALGLLRVPAAVPLLIPLLDDDHEQVRAASIDALGQIGDPVAIAPLLASMSEPTRHERARVVQALRGFGERATRALVQHGQKHETDRATVATVLSFVGGAGASEALLQWSSAADAGTRAAAWTAIGSIGLDERAFYHAVSALNAGEPEVRAAAARALARSGRSDAASQLAGRLDDEWEVASQSARALARLGEPGMAALRNRVDRGEGLGHDLARQVLWESGQR